MRIWIVGIGMGRADLMTMQAREVIGQSDCLIGARRMLDCFPDSPLPKHEMIEAAKIAAFLKSGEGSFERAAIVVSGDTGFYSAAKSLKSALAGFDVTCICGISSLQYFCGLLAESWDDVKVVSLHGREQNLLESVTVSAKTFVLTGGQHSVRGICETLCAQGLGHLRVCVGENLSYCGQERVTKADAHELSVCDFVPLSVMMIYNEQAKRPPVTHGLSDSAFLRGDAPMTKAEVRAASIAAMRLAHGDIVWDIGAGTGSVSIEIARVLPDGAVYAIEKNSAALELLRQNKQHFKIHNLTVIEGTAPDVLETLPAPNVVFIGGSSGGLAGILSLVVKRNPQVRIVVNAITLETVGAALDSFKRLELCEQEIVQLSVAKAKTVGASHMMMGQNPIYILSAGGSGLNDA